MFLASRKDGEQTIKGSAETRLPGYDQRGAKEHILPQTQRGRAFACARDRLALAIYDIRRMEPVDRQKDDKSMQLRKCCPLSQLFPVAIFAPNNYIVD